MTVWFYGNRIIGLSDDGDVFQLWSISQCPDPDYIVIYFTISPVCAWYCIDNWLQLPVYSATIRNGFDKLTYHTQKPNTIRTQPLPQYYTNLRHPTSTGFIANQSAVMCDIFHTHAFDCPRTSPVKNFTNRRIPHTRLLTSEILSLKNLPPPKPEGSGKNFVSPENFKRTGKRSASYPERSEGYNPFFLSFFNSFFL